MNPRNVAMLVTVSLAVAIRADGATIKKLDLSEGYTEANTLPGPVLDGTGVASLSFTEFTDSFDRSALVFRRRSGYLRGGIKATLGPEVSPGKLLTTCLRSEAERMGLPLGADGWKVTGTVREIYFDNDLPSAWAIGAVLYYGWMVVDLDITAPDGARSEETYYFHSYSVQGGRNSPKDALATHLVEGAQEILVRLNRTYLRAAPHPKMAFWADQLGKRGLAGQERWTHAVGLSGLPEAVPVLLRLLEAEKDEGLRSHALDALAHLAPGEMVPILRQRYPGEDDDCRWYTLKALHYSGTAAAREVVRIEGLADPEPYYKALAQLILDHWPGPSATPGPTP